MWAAQRARTHTYTQACTRLHAHTCTHAHARTHTHTHTRAQAHIPAGIQVPWQGASGIMDVTRRKAVLANFSSHLFLFCVRTQTFQILTQSLSMRNHCIPNWTAPYKGRAAFHCSPATRPALCQAHSMQRLTSPLTPTYCTAGPRPGFREAQSQLGVTCR